MSLKSERVPQQPLHPSIIPRLDPEYLEFHNSELIYIVPPHTLPWDPSLRNAPTVPGSSDPLPVGNTKDFNLTHTQVRTYTPLGSPPEGGWPAFIFFHGGGWTFGTINSEASFCTNMCIRAKCVVVSVHYRLAPEHPYPTAVDDAVESLTWVINNGPSKLNINTSKIAVGGSSSGGNLATILALKAVESATQPLPIFQLLIVPVTNNTLDPNTTPPTSTWQTNQHTPWLSPDRMLWFRNNYLPDPSTHTSWDASPHFAPDELVAKLPPTWIAVNELDILCGEGLEYGQKLREQGVQVEIEVYTGAPHPIMAMDGKKLVSDAANALARAFGMA